MSGDDTEGYDQVVFKDEQGKETSMDKKKFKALSLPQRVHLILDRKVEFRLNGKVVSSRVALGSGG